MNRRRRIYFTVEHNAGKRGTNMACCRAAPPPSLLSLQPFSAFCGAIANAVNLRAHTHTLSQSQTTAGMLQNMGHRFRELMSVVRGHFGCAYLPGWSRL